MLSRTPLDIEPVSVEVGRTSPLSLSAWRGGGGPTTSDEFLDPKPRRHFLGPFVPPSLFSFLSPSPFAPEWPRHNRFPLRKRNLGIAAAVFRDLDRATFSRCNWSDTLHPDALLPFCATTFI